MHMCILSDCNRARIETKRLLQTTPSVWVVVYKFALPNESQSCDLEY